MSSIPLVDLALQRETLKGGLEAAYLRVLAGGDYVLGDDVARFEAEFAAYCGVRHAVGVDSGTSALELALRAHEIGRGDDVVIPANTFVATAFAVSHAGARPVLVDVDPTTATMDPALLRDAITPRTRAVIPVHLYGHPADMDGIAAVAREHRVIIIEDACQAHGARYHGKRVGSLGAAAAFSFYPAKPLGAQGDGGMVVTDDAEIAARLRLLRNYGQLRKYVSEVVGFNRRLDTLQAAVLRVKLPHLDTWNAARRAHSARYDDLLTGLFIVRPTPSDDVEAVWHLYVVRVADRDGVRARLAEADIETGVHYPVPVHLQPAYRELGYARGDFPVTEALSDEVLSLPMYPELSGDAIESVVAGLWTCLAREATAAPRRPRRVEGARR
jgi:dTDP-4-amino-4,6-dideoxygalactose transaminase